LVWFYGSRGFARFYCHLFWYDVTVLLPDGLLWLGLVGSGLGLVWSGLVWSGLVLSCRNVFGLRFSALRSATNTSLAS
jgi:hypothetical protein